MRTLFYIFVLAGMSTLSGCDSSKQDFVMVHGKGVLCSNGHVAFYRPDIQVEGVRSVDVWVRSDYAEAVFDGFKYTCETIHTKPQNALQEFLDAEIPGKVRKEIYIDPTTIPDGHEMG